LREAIIISVSTTDYGTIIAHLGTFGEVMAALTGVPATKIINIYYDSGASKTVGIQKS